MNDLSPWVQGQTMPVWEFLCSRGTNVFDLTGQQPGWISLLIYSATQTVPGSYTLVHTGQGTVTVTSSNPGIIQYAPVSGDTSVLIPGQYYMRVKVTFNGTSPDYSDYIPIFIAQ